MWTEQIVDKVIVWWKMDGATQPHVGDYYDHIYVCFALTRPLPILYFGLKSMDLSSSLVKLIDQKYKILIYNNIYDIHLE